MWNFDGPETQKIPYAFHVSLIFKLESFNTLLAWLLLENFLSELKFASFETHLLYIRSFFVPLVPHWRKVSQFDCVLCLISTVFTGARMRCSAARSLLPAGGFQLLIKIFVFSQFFHKIGRISLLLLFRSGQYIFILITWRFFLRELLERT